MYEILSKLTAFPSFAMAATVTSLPAAMQRSIHRLSHVLSLSLKTKPEFTLQRRSFSCGSRRRIMELTSFSEEQLDVREAIARICSNFPDEYWADHDESGEYPHELHTALAKDGWIGIALPEDLGGSGLGISEATMMLQTISQSGAGIAGAQSIHANVYATQPVARFATPEQRKKMLPGLIGGECKACFGVTEPK